MYMGLGWCIPHPPPRPSACDHRSCDDDKSSLAEGRKTSAFSTLLHDSPLSHFVSRIMRESYPLPQSCSPCSALIVRAVTATLQSAPHSYPQTSHLSALSSAVESTVRVANHSLQGDASEQLQSETITANVHRASTSNDSASL
mmetsp:Transcript_26038/g.79174  ORF Transcript_26038/g.79174 Transcript_26038/m.79174 type:complete len:143 (-) Transcript_26038:931-1359(-)|eukprot:scaffold208264_cov32-Tisochrysis_lutea.AAC.1